MKDMVPSEWSVRWMGYSAGDFGCRRPDTMTHFVCQQPAVNIILPSISFHHHGISPKICTAVYARGGSALGRVYYC